MLRKIPSIRAKMIVLVFATSLASLIFAGVVLVAYDIRSNQDSWTRDLAAQADIVGRMSAPALVFGDTLTAHQSLAALALRPEILAAAVYSRNGTVFARFVRGNDAPPIPAARGRDGHRLTDDRLTLFKPIADDDGRVGTIFLTARYDAAGRLSHYIPVLLLVMLGSLLVSLLLSYNLQYSVTAPLLAMSSVARRIREEGNYSLRVRKYFKDETGQLADAFNAMLVEVERAQASLLESNRRKDEFLATLGHELRNPLGPIRNAAHFLRLKGVDSDSSSALELIERQVQQMVRLIEDLLDVSRINRDRVELRLTRFRVRDLVADVLEATQHAVRDAGHRLELCVEDEQVVIEADRARLIQVVCNLLNNAIKYTAAGGQIDLAVTCREGNLVVAVKDSGIGIPPDRLQDIFEPFSQVDQSLEKTRGGLGIGLAISRRLVALHGGTLTAHSEGLGHGSLFCASIPNIAVDAAVSAPAAAREVVAESPSSLRILVADDNVDGARTLGLLLEMLGHQVTVAHDGVEAMRQLESRPFDAAVLDIGMPRKNGYDLAKEIRLQPWGRTLVLIALTGWGQEVDRRRALEAGFDLHLTKPVQTVQLQSALGGIRRTPREDGEPVGGPGVSIRTGTPEL